MAITRTQIAKQLLAEGGRTGYRVGGQGGRAAEGPVERPSGPSGDTNRENRIGDQYTSPEGKAVDRGIDNRRVIDTIKGLPDKLRQFGLKNVLNQELRNPKTLLGQIISTTKPTDLTAQDYQDILGSPELDQFGFTGKDLTRANEVIDALGKSEKGNLSQTEYEKAFFGPKGPPTVDDRGEGVVLPRIYGIPALRTEEQETETEDPQGLEGLRLAFRADGGPIGGEYDFESARQMYGLGKLVKKVTRTVKKIAKSPVGKAAITAASLYYMPKFGIKAQGGLTPFLQGAKTGLTNLIAGAPMADYPGRGPSLFSKIPGGAVTAGIVGASALAGLLTSEQEEEAQTLAKEEGIDIEAARNSILNAGTSQDFRARAFRGADGGSAKEPVAKKTMPLLDMGGQEMDLRAEGGFVPIGRMEKADDVPARLSKNEFVFTADAVRNAGEGDVDKGAEVMYNMMKNLESGGEVSEESQGLEGARRMFQTSQRLEEVL